MTFGATIVGTMDAPPVQFTRTSDGVSIAYTVAGSGLSLVFCWGTSLSHTELVLRSSGLRAPIEERHARNIYGKLSGHNRTHAANWAREHGVI